MKAHSRRRLGILGWMGPQATVDLMHKIILRTPATRDQDHIPLLVHSIPQIPDRTDALLRGGPSPLPAMQSGLRTLVRMGAEAVAIACNTAHSWHGALQASACVTLLHIGDAVAEAVTARVAPGDTIGIVATDGTLHAGFYQQRLSIGGHAVLVNEPEERDRWVMTGIRQIKGGELRAGGALLDAAVASLFDRGAAVVVLACTEIPPGLQEIGSRHLASCVDATSELAEACVTWWRHHRSSAEASSQDRGTHRRSAA